MRDCIIKVAKDFSDAPSGRFRTDSDFSGEVFREEVLVPMLARCESIQIWIDGTSGYPSSFVDEAFGGLYRTGEYSKEMLARKIEIISNSEIYKRYKKMMESALSGQEF